MDAESEPKYLINITRYINPHKFFFKLEYNLSEMEKNIENMLSIYGTSVMQNGYHAGYAPKINEIVAVFMQPWTKWIRAKCDFIAEFVSSEPEFILWSMDDGIPIKSTKKWIFPLPDELADIPAHSIFVGGLNNIIPMERQFNMDEWRSEKVAANDWTELAVKNVSDILSQAAEVWFKPEAKCGAYCFGNVTVKTYAGKRINLSSRLILQDLAKLSNNFERDLSQIDTLAKSRWQKSNGIMDEIVGNSKLFVERGCYRPPKITHEVDAKLIDWRMENERQLKTTESECNQSFCRALEDLFIIKLEVRDPFDAPDEHEHFTVCKQLIMMGGGNHADRLQLFNRLKLRPPHHQSSNSTTDDDRCDTRSIMSTTTIFTNKNVYARTMQCLKLMRTAYSNDDDDDVENDVINNAVAVATIPPAAKRLLEKSIVRIPSGHDEELGALEKFYSNKMHPKRSFPKKNLKKT